MTLSSHKRLGFFEWVKKYFPSWKNKQKNKTVQKPTNQPPNKHKKNPTPKIQKPKQTKQTNPPTHIQIRATLSSYFS